MTRKIDMLRLERALDQRFARYAAPGSPGLIVGVRRGDSVEFVKGWGLASIEHGVPIGPATRFRIASVTKQFTVTAALMLAAEGKLSLDAAPHDYLPELKKLPVTIDQMMRNSSGLPDFLELLRLGGHGLDKPAQAQDLLAVCARNTHLNFPPGSRFLYSNTNFLMLGEIVARLEGAPLADVLRRRVLEAAGLTRTLLAPRMDTVVPDLATSYLGDAEAGFTRAAHAYPQGGEGGLISTVEDLLLWSAAFDAGPLASVLTKLATPKKLTGEHDNPYRRGLDSSMLGRLAGIGHGGLWPGFRTELLRLPAADLAIVVIANLASIDPWRVARDVARLILAGDNRIAEASPLGERDFRPLKGLWFDPAEPALVELDWRAGEPVAIQNGTPFTLAPRADGWLAAERGSFEFAARAGRGATLQVDFGAGRVRTLRRAGRRAAPPAALAGLWRSADAGAEWRIARGTSGWEVAVSGPYAGGGAPWTLSGLDADTVEVTMPAGGWLRTTQLARLERDRAGRIAALSVFTGRVKGLRFERV